MFPKPNEPALTASVDAFIRREEPEPMEAQELLTQRAVLGLYRGLELAAETHILNEHALATAAFMGLSLEDLVDNTRGRVRIKGPDEVNISPQLINRPGIAEYLGRRALDEIISQLNLEDKTGFEDHLAALTTSVPPAINMKTFATANAATGIAGLQIYDSTQEEINTLYMAAIALRDIPQPLAPVRE